MVAHRLPRTALWLLAAGLTLCLLNGRLATAAEDDAAAAISELAIEPARIEVSRLTGEAVSVLAVGRRGGAADPATDIALSYTATPGLVVTMVESSGGADAAWVITVAAARDAPDAAAVDLRLSYDAKKSAEEPPQIKVRRARLEVTVEPPRDGSPFDATELSIKTDFASISELAPVTAYLVAENKSKHPLRLEVLDVAAPDFLKVTLPDKPADLAAHETLAMPLVIKVKGKPQSGEWLILARVAATRGEGDYRRRAVAVLEQKVTVGVPGVSEVLKLLDLPSLLLVPGALIVAIWSLFAGGSGDTKPSWLEWKSSSFWLIAITLSIMIFLGLAFVRSRFALGPDFLVAFGIADAAMLWLGCVAGGAISFGFYRASTASWAGFTAWRDAAARREREPQPTDKPIDILKKLQRADLPFYLPSFTRTVDAAEQTIFALGLPAADGRTWAVPRMLLRKATPDAAAADLVGRIDEANNRSANGLADLIERLDEGLARRWLSLDWEAGDLSRPELLATDKLGTPGDKASPLEYG